MKKTVTFGKVNIQKLNRIAIPKALLENLGLDVGSEVELVLDTEKDEIIIKTSKRKK